MGSDRSPHHLTRARASDFLAARSPLCVSYGPWKEPEKEILHGLARRNKTSPSCRGRDLRGEAGGDKSEEEGDEMGRAAAHRGAFKAIPLPSPPKKFGQRDLAVTIGLALWRRELGGSGEPHGRAEAGCSSSTGVINRVAREMKSQEGSGLAVIRILMRAK